MNRKIILILIVILGLFLRFWQGGLVPTGLNRDEASIGYTAYSLLLTGKDEYGKFLPISIESFGDWKLPGYIYAVIAAVKFFSLNELAVRLPSMVLGTVTIVLVYFLTLEIFSDEKHKYGISFVSALLLAISPWHIHFSRVASEANMSVFFICAAILLFFKGMKSHILLFISAVFLSLSLYTYHGSHIFTPLLFIGLLIVLITRRYNLKVLVPFIIIFALPSIIIFSSTLFSADRTKISGLTPLSDPYTVHEKIDLSRVDHSDSNSFIPVMLHNKLLLLIDNFVQGYLRSFSPEFLFIKGGNNLAHNIPNFGNLYVWESICILLGVYYLFHKKKKWRWLLLFWLLISPIPAAITKDAPHSARMLSFLPLPYILIALGILEIVSIVGGKTRVLVNLVISVVVLFNFMFFLDRYFIHFPLSSEAVWGGGYKELVETIARLGNKYSEIVMDRPEYSPYIYFLFYQKVDPGKYQDSVVRYPVDKEGYHHVEKFETMVFKKLDWSEDLIVPNRLLVTWADSTPPSATQGAVLVDESQIRKDAVDKDITPAASGRQYKIIKRLIKVIRLKNGQPQFYLIDVGKVPIAVIGDEQK